MKISILRIFFLFLFAFFFFFPGNAYADTLFQDDFESNNLSKWEIISGNWVINDILGSKRAGNYIPPSSDAEIQAGDFNWTDYEFSLDVLPVSGVDKNVFFRVRDQRSYALPGHNLPVSYGLHLTTSLLEFQKRTVDGWQMLRSANVDFPFNSVTKITIRVVWPEINIFINDSQNPVIHFVDGDIDFKKGRIALAIITGASPTEVWYDNVVVTDLSPISTPTPTLTPTPTPTPTLIQETPMVFLPGLGGCLNFKEMFLGIDNPDGWKITPGNNVYNNLLKTFEGKDYFHTFCYDWRKPVLENAHELNDFIKNVIQPESNVNLIGHSLGGLVGRACVQTENNCYVNKLITVGSPHQGAVDAYPALEGGEIWRTGPIKLGYELLVHFNQKPGETRRDTIERIAPVLKDLLPDFDYLIKDNQNVSPGSLSFINTLLPLPQLQNLSLLENKTETITGHGYDSVEKIILTDASLVDKLLGNWPDGKPSDKVYTQEGDTSVLTKSASFTNLNIKNHPFNLDHGGIISQNGPLRKILDILGLDLSIANDLIPDEENYLVFVVHSPVKISLSNLPENSYSDDGLIVIPNPENKDYQLLLEGTDNGNYLLSVGQIYQDLVLWSDYAGTIKNNEKKIYHFSINKEVPKENPLISDDNNLLNDSIKSLIDSLKKQINNLKLISKNKKALLNKLSGINYKNHEESLLKLGVFRLAVAQFEKEKQISKVEAEELRDTCMKLAKNLEYLVFSKPKSFPKKQASLLLQQAKNAQKNTENKLTENSAFVFSQGQEYLQKAQESYSSSLYYQTKIYSLEALGLFVEAKILSFP